MYEANNQKKKSGSPTTIILILLFVALLCGGAYLFISSSDGNKLSSSVSDKSDDNSSTNDEAITTPNDPVFGDPNSIDPGTTEGIKFVVENNAIKAIGTADSTTAAGIAGIFEQLYRSKGSNEIVTDANIETPPYALPLAAGIQRIGDFAEDATIEITDTKTVVNATVPNDIFKGLLEESFSTEAGFPNPEFDITVSNKDYLEFVVVGENGNVKTTGKFSPEMVGPMTEIMKTAWNNDIEVDFESDPNVFTPVGWFSLDIPMNGIALFDNFESGMDGFTPYGIFNEGLNFDTAQSQLTAESTQRLGGLLPYLASTRSPILIEGHTDSDGSDEINQKLSEDRANSVAAFLTEQSGGLISTDRVQTVGLGSSQPVSDNNTAEGKASNRRVKISILNPAGEAE